jgi:hypothetical protein
MSGLSVVAAKARTASRELIAQDASVFAFCEDKKLAGDRSRVKWLKS